MPIDYTIVTNPLTTPPTYRPEVVTQQTISLADLVAATAQETAQNAESLMAFLNVVFGKVRTELTGGNAVLWEDTLQIEPTLKAVLNSPTDDLPADATFGISISFTGPYLSAFKADARGHRVEAGSKAPNIIEVAGQNANLLALRPRDLIALRGDRLGFSNVTADEGIWLDPVAAGASIKVPSANIQAKGDKETLFQWPDGIAAQAQYRIRLAARRRGKGIVRSTRWETPVKAA